MSVVPIITPKGKVVITQTTDTVGVSAPNNGGLMYGIIVQQYETSNWDLSELPVMFDPEGAMILNYSGTDYYLVDESKILLREVTPP